MANFTTEAEVRSRFQLSDTTLVPSSLVSDCIDDAHGQVARYLDPEFAEGTPEDALVLGETLLAGAHVFLALASKDAFDQRAVSIGGQRIEPGERFGALMTMASVSEKRAWYLLEPYLLEKPARGALKVTDSTPVLGEE